MDEIQHAEAELYRRQRERIIDRAREAGLSHEVTFVDEVDGIPSAVITVETGACWVDEIAPDRAADN